MSRGAGQRGASPAAVLWDMDGTLVDSEKLWAVALDDYATYRGGTLSQATRQALVGSNMTRSMRLLLDDLGRSTDVAEINAAAGWVESRAAELFGAGLTWRPGAEAALRALSANGIPLALVTSTIRSLTEIALETIGADRFDATVCGDEVDGRNKPAPEPYLRACRMLGVDPVRCIAFEDSPTGVAAAEAAGCTVIAIPSEVPLDSGPRRALRDSIHDVDPLALGELLPATDPPSEHAVR